MNFLPLCTATVWPTNSGRMVERRDQVRTTFFSLAAVSTASLASRCVSVNGPFLTDLPMSLPLLGLARDDPLVGSLVVARLEAARGLAPGRHRVTAAGGFALATAVRMVDRVHRDAAVMRGLAQPARAPVLYALVIMLLVANTINVAADVAAMGQSLQLVIGGPTQAYTVAFGVICLVLEIYLSYRRYVAYLKWLTLVL